MKKLLTVLLLFEAALAILVTTALGDQSSSFIHGWQLDENGPYALFITGTTAGHSAGTNQVDPTSGISGWYYPFNGLTTVPGDVLLLEPDGFTTSDLLRFDGNGVFFFSLLDPNDPNPSRADVPFLPDPIDPVILTEFGTGGTNGTIYAPAPGMPGRSLIADFPNIQYNIISDIPEPDTMSLVGLSGVVLLLVNPRKKIVRPPQ